MDWIRNMVVRSDLYGKYKDANEYLIADRKRFIERIKKAIC